MKSEAEVMRMFETALRCFAKVDNMNAKEGFLTEVTVLQKVLELDDATIAAMLEKEINVNKL